MAAKHTQHGSSFFKNLGKSMADELVQNEIVAGTFVCNILHNNVAGMSHLSSQQQWQQHCRPGIENKLM